MRRAGRSALYRRAWGRARARFAAIDRYADLRAVPFVSGEDLRSMQQETDPSTWAACDRVRLWVSTSGTTGTPKWVPISDVDLEESERTSQRTLDTIGVLSPDERALGLNAPAPFYTDLLSCGGLGPTLEHGLRTQGTVVSFSELHNSLTFALRQGPCGFFAFPSVAMALAEGMITHLPELVRDQVKDHPWLAGPLTFVLQRIVHARPRNFLRFRWGVFSGEPLEPYRQAIRDAWGMESYEVYGMSELRATFCECAAQSGIHVWLDQCLPEIIPLAELERVEDHPDSKPTALPLWLAEPGLVGELVLTTFSDAMPLIRYRTSDLVQVVGTERCACGRLDPRIRVLHRADDIVNLGIVRFSLLAVGEALARLREHGRVADWQLRVTRKGYKPKLIVIAHATGVSVPELMAEDIRQALESIPTLREGLKANVVLEPEVRLDDRLAQQRTGGGKLRRLIYEREATVGA